MPHDCQDFKQILKDWPHEPWTSWSEDEPTEAKFRGAKLDKYNMDIKKTYKDIAEVETAEEKLCSTTEAVKSDTAMFGIADKDPVKIENPAYIDMAKELRIVACAEGALSKSHRDLKKLNAEMIESKDARCHALII